MRSLLSREKYFCEFLLSLDFLEYWRIFVAMIGIVIDSLLRFCEIFEDEFILQSDQH